MTLCRRYIVHLYFIDFWLEYDFDINILRDMNFGILNFPIDFVYDRLLPITKSCLIDFLRNFDML